MTQPKESWTSATNLLSIAQLIGIVLLGVGWLYAGQTKSEVNQYNIKNVEKHYEDLKKSDDDRFANIQSQINIIPELKARLGQSEDNLKGAIGINAIQQQRIDDFRDQQSQMNALLTSIRRDVDALINAANARFPQQGKSR